MAGVPQQRDASAIAPARQRVSIKQCPHETRPRRGNEIRDGWRPVTKIMRKIGRITRLIPALAPPALGLDHADEIDEFAAPDAIGHGMPPRSRPHDGCLRQVRRHIGGNCNAPGDRAGVARIFRADHLLAHSGAHPIGANQEIARKDVSRVEPDAHARPVQHIGRHARAKPHLHTGEFSRAFQDFDQVRAMDVQVRCAIALLRFPRDGDGEHLLPRPPDPHLERLGSRGHREDRIDQAKRREAHHGVGRELYAGANLGEGGGPLHNLNLITDLAERDGRAEPAYASACDHDLHAMGNRPVSDRRHSRNRPCDVVSPAEGR